MFEFFKKLWGPKINFNALISNGAIIIDVRSLKNLTEVILRVQKIFPLI
jgi:hypothetical protein